MAATILPVAPAASSVISHHTDADCERAGTVDPETGDCHHPDCGVGGSDPCFGCGGRRFHVTGCLNNPDPGAESDPAADHRAEVETLAANIAAGARRLADLACTIGPPTGKTSQLLGDLRLLDAEVARLKRYHFSM